jgi:hypothetical protein
MVIVDGQKGMADYYSLISDAIAALDDKSGEGRHVFYGRARTTFVVHLRKAAPPLPETLIEQERLALEDAITEVEADATPDDATWLVPNGLQTQSDHTEDDIHSAELEASWAQIDAKVRMWRFAFLGFMIVSVVWIGDLVYKPPTFSGWYDWWRHGGVIFFPAMAILSYFIIEKNLLAELIQMQKDLGRYREQLDAFITDKIGEVDRKKYQIEPKPNPVLRGIWFLIALIGVVVIGGGLVIYSLLRT